MAEDTIAAIATAIGESGINIIRLSGSSAIDILDKIFVPTKGKSIRDYPARRLTHGRIRDPQTKNDVDEVLAVYMKAPYTYTAEDVAEIDCHGGIVPTRKILELTLRYGARMAEPGEFTKRAFLNGRIDLAQAEAVIDLIRAKTDKGFDVAFHQLEGDLSNRVKTIRDQILDLVAHIAVNIDFPDEDIEEITYQEIEEQAQDIHQKITKLLDTADTGRIIREGIHTVIIGKPNVGKSSLLNALLRESRAIVTEVPGTTRDVIEEFVNIRGIPLKIVDTAGIRETEDQVEKLGVQRSKELFNKADLIIFVINASEPLSEEDWEIIELISEKQAIVLLNKTDLPMKIEEEEIRKVIPGKKIIKTSLVEGIGLEALEDAIAEMIYGGAVQQNETFLVTNTRHKHALEKAKESIEDAIHAVQAGTSLDLIEIDVKDTWEYLGEITGDTASEDIINAIFANFCLGK